MTTADQDIKYMSHALGLAKRGLGSTWPNPSVGCILVRDGRIVGRGITQPGGRPHAEVVALAQAGDSAKDATAYVTLEPCSHYGKSPPCCDALIAAGVARVVMALEDTDPRVSGRGRKRLEDAGIEVVSGVLKQEARRSNEGFFRRIELNRPMVTLKIAASLDSRSALSSGESQWITGNAAREHSHKLRAEHDAIMVGTGTAKADNPGLDCRLPGMGALSPVRVVLDRTLALPTDLKLFDGTGAATWVATSSANGEAAKQRLPETCVSFGVREDQGRLDVSDLLSQLAERGITRLLVESGGALAASLIRFDLVDRLIWFSAPSLIGADGRAAIAPLGLQSLADQPRYELVSADPVGQDMMSVFRRYRDDGFDH